MRINPEIKQQVEEVYAKQGLTFTDAVNIFIPMVCPFWHPLRTRSISKQRPCAASWRSFRKAGNPVKRMVG